jgi:hypothetical protein
LRLRHFASFDAIDAIAFAMPYFAAPFRFRFQIISLIFRRFRQPFSPRRHFQLIIFHYAIISFRFSFSLIDYATLSFATPPPIFIAFAAIFRLSMPPFSDYIFSFFRHFFTLSFQLFD